MVGRLAHNAHTVDGALAKTSTRSTADEAPRPAAGHRRERTLSHTLAVKIEMRDHAALTAAAKVLGGSALGEGSHHFYSSTEQGFGIRLPGWTYPMVAKPDGTLAYDDCGGRWGNARDIDKLYALYTLQLARTEAERLGWMTEMRGESLVIFHPDGGTLTLSPSGEIHARGFTGSTHRRVRPNRQGRDRRPAQRITLALPAAGK